MKILNIEWEAFGIEDMKEAFSAEGHQVISFPFSKRENAVENSEVENRFLSVLRKEVPDVVFSFDYYPIFSKVCQQEKIFYISWVYDNPQILLFSDTIKNSCNRVCIFDKNEYLKFYRKGVKTVYYMPLAVNTERLDRMLPPALSYKYDISFVGSFYTEENTYFERLTAVLPEYTKGYLDALITVQKKIQGYNFVEEVLSPVTGDLYKALPVYMGTENRATREYFYAHYVINRKITSVERMELLSSIAKKHTVDLFTLIKEFSLSNIRNHGAIDPYKGTPFVYRQSKINLNITLRSIESGIPLRAFDIMGSGGFLLSNFQNGFLDLFTPGQDFVYYENKEDLLRKVDYYLIHEDECRAIAKNGHDRVAAAHTFRHRVREMFEKM